VKLKRDEQGIIREILYDEDASDGSGEADNRPRLALSRDELVMYTLSRFGQQHLQLRDDGSHVLLKWGDELIFGLPHIVCKKKK